MTKDLSSWSFLWKSVNRKYSCTNADKPYKVPIVSIVFESTTIGIHLLIRPRIL